MGMCERCWCNDKCSIVTMNMCYETRRKLKEAANLLCQKFVALERTDYERLQKVAAIFKEVLE